MTTWYTYSIHLSKGTLASAMAKIDEILHRQNWTYDRFLYHARQSLTGLEPDCGKANAELLDYYHSIGIPDDYLSMYHTNVPFVIFGNYDHKTGEILHNDPAFDRKIRSLFEKTAFTRRIGSSTVIYQGINWRGRRTDITHDRYGRFVDSIVLFGGKYITLNIVVDDLSDTSDRIAAVFTEAFGHPYREKHMQSALTMEEQSMPLDFPKLKFDFRRRGLYHPPSEDRSKTGKSVRLKTALERVEAAEHYKIHTGKGGGTFLERRNERNHVMTVFFGCSCTGEIGVDGETLLQSATCNAMYEGVNFTRMLFQMHSHLTTQRALDEFVAYSLDCIDRMYDELQKYHITDIETPPWFNGFYTCYN